MIWRLFKRHINSDLEEFQEASEEKEPKEDTTSKAEETKKEEKADHRNYIRSNG